MTSMKQSLFVVLATAINVSGHVRLRYSYENQGPAWPIRNAPSEQSDGSFSVR